MVRLGNQDAELVLTYKGREDVYAAELTTDTHNYEAQGHAIPDVLAHLQAQLTACGHTIPWLSILDVDVFRYR